MSETARPQAYTGSEPYIFVSYAHKDKETVFPFISALQKRFRVWYDDGLHYGREWDEEILQRLDGCAVFLFMVTENALASANCRDELHLARESGKNFINILVRGGLALPGWFQFRYSRFQACLLDTFPTLDAAVDDLIRKCDWLAALERKRDTPPEQPAENVFAIREANPAPPAASEPGRDDRFPVCENLKAPSADESRTDRQKEIEAAVARLSDRFAFSQLPDGSWELKRASTGITSVELPDFVSAIGDGAFSGCGARKEVTIPGGVKEIGEKAFEGCTGLSRVRLGRGLMKVGEDAFWDCTKLKTVVYEGSLEEWCAIDFVGIGIFREYSLFLNGSDEPLSFLAFPDGVTSFSRVFHMCQSITDVVIGRSVTEIPSDAFDSCKNLVSVTIPDGIGTIGSDAFSCCYALSRVSIGCGITEIESHTFSFCEDLHAVSVPEGVTRIDSYAFCNSGLTEITLPASLTKVGENAFDECKLQAVNYRGTREQWRRIAVKRAGNESLKRAKVNFNYRGS